MSKLFLRLLVNELIRTSLKPDEPRKRQKSRQIWLFRLERAKTRLIGRFERHLFAPNFEQKLVTFVFDSFSPFMVGKNNWFRALGNFLKNGKLFFYNRLTRSAMRGLGRLVQVLGSVLQAPSKFWTASYQQQL